jgi:predicted hydrocarbon binding protein
MLQGGSGPLAETRAYFPSREQAEQFARQFEGSCYHIDILPQQRHGRDVFQVHVRRGDEEIGMVDPAAADIMRTLSTMGARADGAGIDGDTLSRRMGRALGEALAAKTAPQRVPRREALDRLAALLQQCSLGGLGVVSVTPLVVRVQAPPSAAYAARARGCAHVAGFLEGALGQLLAENPHVREIDCVALGNPYCTFSVDV